MHLKRLRVENFRALKKIDVEFDTRVSVIIGPNAIGKTTVLEAIRLAKGVLAPRTQNEANSVLQTIGAASPHLPHQLMPAAFTNDPSRPTVIKCAYELADVEIAKIKEIAPRLATTLAQQSAGLAFATAAQAVGFFSSPMGQQALRNAQTALSTEIAKVDTDRVLNLNLTVNFQTTNLSGEFQVQQLLFAALESSLPPSSSLFSYFPADRALPVGEQPVQLGGQDAATQLESYNAQPQLKYHRLKNAIFNSIVDGEEGRSRLKAQFEMIFGRILRGRELGVIGLNQLGFLSIPIRDVESGAQFQIDGLSSGEKGLILTFLLIAQNVANGGVVLLDEPELHLNPAVCRDLLQFFVDEYADKNNLQGIICSHSAEILAGTFERESCSLFHLRDGETLAKVRHRDQGEIRDALKRLGSSESESLLYKGTVYVEGIHDVEVVHAGFDDLFRRYRVIERGGRREVEKDIKKLQKAERDGREIGNHYFVFDHDRKPTSLTDSTCVKLLQLDRYCLENFLLDAEALTDLSQDTAFAATPKGTVTEMRNALRTLALAQMDEFVAREVFRELGLESVGFDMKALRQQPTSGIAGALAGRIEAMVALFDALKESGFAADFQRRFEQKRREHAPVWDADWALKCNGKRLFEDLREQGHFKGDLLKLKKAVMELIRRGRTNDYKALARKLKALIGDEVDPPGEEETVAAA